VCGKKVSICVEQLNGDTGKADGKERKKIQQL
jgi:hypothetical protein